MDCVTNDNMIEKGVDESIMANRGEWKKMTGCPDPSQIRCDKGRKMMKFVLFTCGTDRWNNNCGKPMSSSGRLSTEMTMTMMIKD